MSLNAFFGSSFSTTPRNHKDYEDMNTEAHRKYQDHKSYNSQEVVEECEKIASQSAKEIVEVVGYFVINQQEPVYTKKSKCLEVKRVKIKDSESSSALGLEHAARIDAERELADFLGYEVNDLFPESFNWNIICQR
jgi:hypothetical protein